MPHIHKLIDFTSEVYVVYKNKVLLRKHDKLGIWLSVGGHIELDEDPNEAAIREVKEEVGLDVVLDNSLRIYNPPPGVSIKELIPPYFLNRHQFNSVHQHITFVYFAKSLTDKIYESKKTEKSPEIKWFTKEELEKSTEIKDDIKFYALTALERLSE